MSQTDVESLAAQLWSKCDGPEGMQVYAVIDAARDPRIYPMILNTRLEHCCLFAGTLSPALRQAAPYLVHLEQSGKWTQEFLRLGWQDHWGILALAPSDVTITALRRHLRTLLEVRDEVGRTLMFRFYDPRVLRIYLRTCNQIEKRRLFGAIYTFACHDPAQPSIVEFHTLGRLVATVEASDAHLVRPDLGTVTIRQAQLDAFELWLADDAARSMTAFLRQDYPFEWLRMGDDVMYRFASLGLERSSHYGFNSDVNVYCYLQMMMAFGEHFDIDPALEWAARILSDGSLEEDDRAQALCDQASVVIDRMEA